MELYDNENYFKGEWTKNEKGESEFFIINEAIIQSLCVLGEEYEPCFEGATITAPKIQFSLDDDFKNQMFSFMTEIKELIKEGGNDSMSNEEMNTPVVEETAADFAKEEEKEKCPECGKPLDECTCEDKDKEEENKKDKYVLEEIPEYVELSNQFSALEAAMSSLKEEKTALEAEINELKEFKKGAERKEKQDMIDSFYMLSDEDKKDVVENIDSYSLDDIEAKLSIICVRNKVSFNLEEDNAEMAQATTYSLNNDEVADSETPAWIKAVQAVAKNI